MIKAVMFVLGFICGAVCLMVFTCLVVAGEADAREERFLKEHERNQDEKV